jgi:energy-coupling factor transport system ATP-binding protein
MMALLEARGLSFQYEDQEFIFRDLNLQINRGDILGVTGLSGGGKSTLCNCLCGIIPHVIAGSKSGGVYLNKKEVGNMELCHIAEHIGMVFQNAKDQFFSPVLEENLAFGPENLCLSREEIGKRVDGVLKLTGLERYRFFSPFELSGGQQQLAALACVLTLEPDILIFDEVSAQLDTRARQLIQDVVKDLSARGKAVIMVEHDMDGLALAHRVITIGNGSWSIEADRAERGRNGKEWKTQLF